MKHLFLFLLLSSIGFKSFATSEVLPWPKQMARVTALSQDRRVETPFTIYVGFAGAWAEVIAALAGLAQKPDLKMSFEYLSYRMGYLVISQADYTEKMPFAPLTAENQAMYDSSLGKTVHPDKFKGPNWIHLIHPLDRAESNCLTVSKINGVYGGCGDIFQDGLTEDEVVCFKGKTHLKCHIQCMEKIYNRVVDVESGFCPASEE